MSVPVRPTIPGCVYVLASGSHPGIVKVGRTSRSAYSRALELDVAPGYAAFAPWREVWSEVVSDTGYVEGAAHRMLAHHRIRFDRIACRELFRVEPAEARRVVSAAAQSLRGRPRAVPARRERAGVLWRRAIGRLAWMALLLWCALSLLPGDLDGAFLRMLLGR